jgi:hypothetical protein
MTYWIPAGKEEKGERKGEARELTRLSVATMYLLIFLVRPTYTHQRGMEPGNQLCARHVAYTRGFYPF